MRSSIERGRGAAKSRSSNLPLSSNRLPVFLPLERPNFLRWSAGGVYVSFGVAVSPVVPRSSGLRPTPPRPSRRGLSFLSIFSLPVFVGASLTIRSPALRPDSRASLVKVNILTCVPVGRKILVVVCNSFSFSGGGWAVVTSLISSTTTISSGCVSTISGSTISSIIGGFSSTTIGSCCDSASTFLIWSFLVL